MPLSPSPFFRLCTQDGYGYTELVEENNGKWHYFLFDSPHKPWKIFDSFDACLVFMTQNGQILQTFDTPEAYDQFCRSVEITQDNVWWNGIQLLEPERNARLWPQYLDHNTHVQVDTGKDFIDLVQEEDLTFAWIPHQDPSYRNLGERMVTIQDAIRKIEDMPITITTQKQP